MDATHDRDVCGLLLSGRGDCPGCVAVANASAAAATDAERAEAAAYLRRIEINRVVDDIAELLDMSAQDVRTLVPLLRRMMLHVHQTGRI